VAAADVADRVDRGEDRERERERDRRQAGGAIDAGAGQALVLLDLGSAALSLELATEELSDEERARVRISEAPLVEGAVLAAVQASIGASIDDVAAAAEGAASMTKLPRP
jgi:PTS hybrid protein